MILRERENKQEIEKYVASHEKLTTIETHSVGLVLFLRELVHSGERIVSDAFGLDLLSRLTSFGDEHSCLILSCDGHLTGAKPERFAVDLHR